MPKVYLAPRHWQDRCGRSITSIIAFPGRLHKVNGFCFYEAWHFYIGKKMVKIITLQGNRIVSIENEVDEINHEHLLWLKGEINAIEHVIRCGQLLLRKKDELPRGEWLPWVAVNCSFSINTARNYMKIASNSERAMDLPEDITSMHLILKILNEPRDGTKVHKTHKTAFTWFKEENVIAMKKGTKAIQKCIDILINANKDRKVAIYIIKMERKALSSIIEKIDRKTLE